MTPEVWYVAGSGLLVGADRRWLLLDDAPDEAFVSTLWETISGSSVDRVLAVLEGHYGDRLPSLAMTGGGREIARGSGEVTSDRAGVMLSLGPAALQQGQGPGRRLPFRGGVVSASVVEIVADVPASPSGGPGLIDGIPDEVLSSVGPDIPVRARQTAREASEARLAAHTQGHTQAPPPRPPADSDATGPIHLTREPPAPGRPLVRPARLVSPLTPRGTPSNTRRPRLLGLRPTPTPPAPST